MECETSASTYETSDATPVNSASSSETYSSDKSQIANSKRRKVVIGGSRKKGLDCISNLPNSLVVQILSFLQARDAVRTAVLSKRWRDQWTYSPVLNLDMYKAPPRYYMTLEHMRRFMSLVNSTLLFYRSLKFDKMIINMSYNISFRVDINAWVLFAVKKSAHELQLSFSKEVASNNSSSSDSSSDDDDSSSDDDDHASVYVLPAYLLNYSCLTTLKISNCRIGCHKQIMWKSLKDLLLSSMSLTNCEIWDILAGSPALESIEIRNCYGFDYIDIKSTNLAKLVIISDNVYKIKSKVNVLGISAPYLKSLQISGQMSAHSVSLINTSVSLVDAKIQFILKDVDGDFEKSRESFTDTLRGLVEKLHHVKNLTLGNWCLQVVSAMEANALPCPFPNRVCLRVSTSLENFELIALTRLLALSPHMDTLVLHITPVGLCQVESDLKHLFYVSSFYLVGPKWCIKPKSEFDWASQKNLLAVPLLNLTILDFGGSKKEMEFIAFMLNNAKWLEKLIIQRRYVSTPQLKRVSANNRTIIKLSTTLI